MESEDYKNAPNVPFESFHADGLNPENINGLFPGSYYELAAVCVDDLLAATHESVSLAKDFIRRFSAKITNDLKMYMGFDLEQNLTEGWITIGLKSCLERAVERFKDLSPEETNLRSIAGVLLWVSLHIFGTYLVEVKALTRRANQNLQEDVTLSIGLLFEIYQRRGQQIFYRRKDNNLFSFIPRSSRIDGVIDVSEKHKSVPAHNGEIIVTPKDIFDADGMVDIYQPEDCDDFQPEHFITDHSFQLSGWSDATCAHDESSRRSDLGIIVMVNDAPVDWDAARMSGVADSSMSSEYCGMSKCTKRMKAVRTRINFMGIQPKQDRQWCDSTSAKMIAKNPKSLGAARFLGIRMHYTRYAIAHESLSLEYCITEDMVADCLTKRLPRKKLARFSVIFFNNLRSDWQKNPDRLLPRQDSEWYPDLSF